MTDRIMIQFRDTRLLYSNWKCEGAGVYVCKTGKSPNEYESLWNMFNLFVIGVF